jgi:hypothetical protein
MKTALIDIVTLKALAICISTEETRYYLNGVSVEIERRAVTYCATDCKRLAARRLTLDKREADNTLLGQFIIDAATIKAFKIGKRATKLYQRMDSEGQMFAMIDGTFPDWRRCVPREPMAGPEADMDFNKGHAHDFDKIGAMLGIGTSRIAANGAEPALVDWRGDSDGTMIGIAMPTRAAALRETILPAWFTTARAKADAAAA